jgi:MFS family permease
MAHLLGDGCMRDRHDTIRVSQPRNHRNTAVSNRLFPSRYDQGVFGGVIVTPDFLDLLGIADDAKLQSTVTAIYDVGCFFGAISTIWIGEALGRKKTILLGTTIMSIGAILQIAAFGVPQMIVGRIIAGIGNGINTSTAPVWQGETSKASWRGKLIVIEMICNIFGFMLSTYHLWTMGFP